MSRKMNLFDQNTIQYDLALEAHDLLRGERGGEIPGVILEEKEYPGVIVKTVTIQDEKGAKAMHKDIGQYITLSSSLFLSPNKDHHHRIVDILAKHLHILSPLKENDTVLVVGLGNRHAIADSLGPKICDKLIATRHLRGKVPQNILQGIRSVSILSPGVLGITGIETAEVVSSIIQRIHPNIVIACDALAAGDVSRIGTTIQLSDSGIRPGSGLGNTRQAFHVDTLGVPVISIGVPTVVNGVVIANNILESVFHHLSADHSFQEFLQNLPEDILSESIHNVLSPYDQQLSVTPKEIDDLIEHTSSIIAQALTKFFHPNMNAHFANLLL